MTMKKRLELLVRLVDGSQLYWDASVTVEAITAEEMLALMPRSTEEKLTADVKYQMQQMIREKFREAADRLFERALQRTR